MSKQQFVIFMNEKSDSGEIKKMYFTGTKWGVGYFNQISGACFFDDKTKAEEAKAWLNESVEPLTEHFIEPVYAQEEAKP